MLFSRSLKCGTCQAAIRAADASRYSAEEMRQMARAGFGDVVPMLQTEKPDERRNAFLKFSESYQTKWAICPACEILVQPYRAGASKTKNLSKELPVGGPLFGRIHFAIRNPLWALIAIGKSEFFLKALAFVLVISSIGIWTSKDTWYPPWRWWWESRSAIAHAEERANAKDWHSVRIILRDANRENPGNPYLLRRAVNIEIMLDRPDIAAVHLQALASIRELPVAERQQAFDAAQRIATRIRERAREIVLEVFRLYETLPRYMQAPHGRPFELLEAITIPPITGPMYLQLLYTPGSFDRTHAICLGIEGACNWSFAHMPWHQILNTRYLRVSFPDRAGKSPCCELSLHDPDLEHPAHALSKIAHLQKEHQLREMLRLATKLAFVANMIAFNERRPPGFR